MEDLPRSEEHTSELQSPVFPYTTLFRSLSQLASFTSEALVSQRRFASAASAAGPVSGTSFFFANSLPVTAAISGAVARKTGVSAPFAMGPDIRWKIFRDRKSIRLNSSHPSFPTRRSSDL